MRVLSVKTAVKTTVAYLAIIGFISHCLLAYVYLFKPSYYDKAKGLVFDRLETHIPYIATIRGNQTRNYDLNAEIELNFENWAPDKNVQSSLVGNIVHSENYNSLTEAAKSLNNGDTLLIKGGVYQSPLVIKANNVTVAGSGHTVIENTSAEGKAAIVIKGKNTTVQNIECRFIKVRDENGACVRLSGTDLTLKHVYFHSSQQGILTGGNSGRIVITDSRFEKLGYKGQAHAIYVGSGELHIRDSLVLASKSQGHEIKSRAHITSITNSTISSMSSEDSRLIDITNGGSLTITRSLLHQGPRSVNADMIGFGLEGLSSNANRIEIKNGTILLERQGHNQLLHTPDQSIETNISGNFIIVQEGKDLGQNNIVFTSREEAGLPEYPVLLNHASKTE